MAASPWGKLMVVAAGVRHHLQPPGPCPMEGCGAKVFIPCGRVWCQGFHSLWNTRPPIPCWGCTWPQDNELLQELLLLNPTPKHPSGAPPGLGRVKSQLGAHPCSSAVLEPAGWGPGIPCSRQGFRGDGCRSLENQFLQDVQILLVPQPSRAARGCAVPGGRRSLGCPGLSPNPPSEAGCVWG